MRSEALEKAYRATMYRVFLPGGAVDLRLGEVSRALVDWLAGQGTGAWAIVTAHNPAGSRLPAPENAERQAELECALLEKGAEPWAAANIADDPEWPDEDSCLVVGMDVQEVMELAARFGQNAIIVGGEHGFPELVWLGK